MMMKSRETLRKCSKRLQFQVKSQILESLDPILIISFLSFFKLACDTNEVREGAAL